MKCRDCDKRLKGGFKQEDSKFLCFRCVCIEIEKGSIASISTKIVELCNEALLKRPTKAQVRSIKSVARFLLERKSLI